MGNVLSRVWTTAGSSSLSVVFVVLNFLLQWPILKASTGLGDRPFGDLLLVLESGECFRDIGFEVYSSSATAEMANCPSFVYGSLPLLIAALLGSSMAGVFGVFQALLFAAMMGLWCQHLFDSKWVGRLISIAMLATPPMQLMMVRGNLDIWIGSLLLLLLIKEGAWSGTRRLIPITIATLVKFYTLPLLIVSSFRSVRSVGNNFAKLGLLSLLAGAGVVLLLDLSKIESLPTPTEASFGINSFQMYLQYFKLDVPGLVPIIGTIALMLFPLMWSSWRRKLTESDADDTGFLEISLVLLFVFFATQNYDHRLFLVTFLVAMALKPSTEFPRAVAWIGYASCWLSSSLGIQFANSIDSDALWTLAGGAQFLGDVFLAIFVGAIFVRLFAKVIQWFRVQQTLGKAC